MTIKGICSRREADFCIQNAWVLVDGHIVNTLGTKVKDTVDVQLTPEGKAYIDKKISVILNKPIGYVSSQPEKNYSTASELLLPKNRYSRFEEGKALSKEDLSSLAPVGRLDIESKGLLVLSQDGRLTKSIIGPSASVEKEYLVRVEGEVTEEALDLLHKGLYLDGQPLKPVKIMEIEENLLKMVLIEGRKRQIRRMCELVKLQVTGLKRVRIGSLMLADLPEGQWRLLSHDEKLKFLK
ncbi:MAG: rRNA pseudouridine synthase [Bdellovibrionaceae bacterium]|nr:rRNA pseudouridine synthase [Pseudobdellovibrionaceae bacterium]